VVDQPVIEISGLTKEFDGVRAIDGLTLSVASGSIFGFLGPNGAGKTTTINILLGLLRPDGGSARVLGMDTVAQGDRVRTRVGALLDETGVYPQLTVEQNLVFYARVFRLGDTTSKVVETALDRAGLSERRHELASTLSKGMQQRLALARARLHRPELLFLDEPTVGLDVMAAREVRESLRQVAEGGTTVFLTTHNMTEAEELCERVAIIRAGRLLAEAKPSALLTKTGYEVVIEGSGLQDAIDTIRLREDVVSAASSDGRLQLRMTTDDPSPVIAELVGLGASVKEVSRGSRLEDAFVELMRESE
jgi:ABC-2 type transport system ATP-binding protein